MKTKEQIETELNSYWESITADGDEPDDFDSGYLVALRWALRD